MGRPGYKHGAKMKVLTVFVGLLWIISVKSAGAYFDTGNALLAACQGSSPYDAGQCLGTIVGQYDMMLSLGYDCGNETIKNKQQLRDVVVKYLRDHPAQRHDQSANLSFLAFFLAFECKYPSKQ